jgi:hypothetical protein
VGGRKKNPNPIYREISMIQEKECIRIKNPNNKPLNSQKDLKDVPFLYN